MFESIRSHPFAQLFMRLIPFVWLLSSCTIGSPFKGPGFKSGTVTAETNNDQVIVGLTYIQTGPDDQKNDLFWNHVMQVYDSMESHKGLIGYAIRRELFGDQGWTMSVWENEQSLNDFVRSEIHQAAIKNGMPALEQTRFARLTVHKDQIPLKWEEATEILRASTREY